MLAHIHSTKEKLYGLFNLHVQLNITIGDGNTYILLCISLLSELPIIWMYRNSIAENQQEITGIVRALIFILVVQTLLSAVLSFTYRKKK